MTYRIGTVVNKLRNMRVAGVLVGIAVDLLVLTVIPGSSIIEGILAFIAGLSAGVAFMRRHNIQARSNKYIQPVYAH